MKSFTIFFILIFLVSLNISCSSYYVGIETLKSYYQNIDSNQFEKVRLHGMYGESYTYLASPIGSIEGSDRKDKTMSFLSGPSIILKITEMDKSITSFYFDRFYMDDSAVYGVESRALPVIKSINIKNIKSIEILDRNWGFEYVN